MEKKLENDASPFTSRDCHGIAAATIRGLRIRDDRLYAGRVQDQRSAAIFFTSWKQSLDQRLKRSKLYELSYGFGICNRKACTNGKGHRADGTFGKFRAAHRPEKNQQVVVTELQMDLQAGVYSAGKG